MENKKYLKLPCGCEFLFKKDVFYIKPCSQTCKRFNYVMAKTKEKGNKVVYTTIEVFRK